MLAKIIALLNQLWDFLWYLSGEEIECAEAATRRITIEGDTEMALEVVEGGTFNLKLVARADDNRATGEAVTGSALVSSNPAIAEIVNNADGTATVHGVAPGVVQISGNGTVASGTFPCDPVDFTVQAPPIGPTSKFTIEPA